MQVFLKNISIWEASGLRNRKVDLFIKEGIIEAIGENLPQPNGVQVLEDLVVTPGWMDLGVQIGEPGFETTEDLQSIVQAAANGGYTCIAAQPNTQPVRQSKSEILFLTQNAPVGPVNLIPLGAVSENCSGKDLTEMMEMHRYGVRGFTDGDRPIQDAGLMMRALQYVKAFDGIVFNQPFDAAIARDGTVHEGVISTSLGLKGIPAIAEEMMVNRDIELAKYTQSRLHISGVSSSGSVDLIRQAKASGVQVTASVPFLNLIYTTAQLSEFDSIFKVLPPLREKDDQEALWEGLKDGTLDCICSNHVPVEIEKKKLEFPYAAFGASTIESVYPLLNTFASYAIEPEEWVKWFSVEPRRILNLPVPVIESGEQANLTLINPNSTTKRKADSFFSKSKNIPGLDSALKGGIAGVINNKEIRIFNQL